MSLEDGYSDVEIKKELNYREERLKEKANEVYLLIEERGVVN